MLKLHLQKCLNKFCSAFYRHLLRECLYNIVKHACLLDRMTAPNRLVRLARDGTISYSQRLTLATKCRMNLRYPAL